MTLNIAVTVDEAEMETEPLEVTHPVCVLEGTSDTEGATEKLEVTVVLVLAVIEEMPVREYVPDVETEGVNVMSEDDEIVAVEE